MHGFISVKMHLTLVFVEDQLDWCLVGVIPMMRIYLETHTKKDSLCALPLQMLS